jgi:hypothetical protein
VSGFLATPPLWHLSLHPCLRGRKKSEPPLQKPQYSLELWEVQDSCSAPSPHSHSHGVRPGAGLLMDLWIRLAMVWVVCKPALEGFDALHRVWPLW